MYRDKDCLINYQSNIPNRVINPIKIQLRWSEENKREKEKRENQIEKHERTVLT